MMQRDIHLKPKDILQSLSVNKDSFGSIAIVSGQSHRAKKCLKKIRRPVKNFSFLGYTFWTGQYKGKKVTVGNGGLYSPDTAFITELLSSLGIETFIRIGSCGSLSKDIDIGDYVLVNGIIKGDGATKYYVDSDYEPVIDKDINRIIENKFLKDGKVYLGTVWTTDALFRETKEIVNSHIKKGAIAVDMVTSAFLTVSSLYNKRANAILAVSDNLITGAKGFRGSKFLKAEKIMVDRIFEVLNEL